MRPVGGAEPNPAYARHGTAQTDGGPPPARPVRRPRATFLPELEGLRGVAILLVYFFHADAILGFPFRNRSGRWPSLPVALVWSGYTGVSLFFVLSAFLLALPFFAEADGGRPVALRTFYARRALRILPLFYVAVLLATLLKARDADDLRNAIPYLTFAYSWPGVGASMLPFSAAWWSLAVECNSTRCSL
jgi:peptidoglycan/LPS O-acetylase OafA/YrhL